MAPLINRNNTKSHHEQSNQLLTENITNENTIAK